MRYISIWSSKERSKEARVLLISLQSAVSVAERAIFNILRIL